MDIRHRERIKVVQKLFSSHFSIDGSIAKNAKIVAILKKQKSIDKKIAAAAPKFPVDKIGLVDLSILRLSIFDLLYEKKTPPKVVINEAVELAKELSSERSPAFVNAVLGAIYNKKKKDD